MRDSILPTLFGEGYGAYRARGSAFVFSYAANLLIAAILIWSAHWFVEHRKEIKQQVTGLVTDLTPYVLSPAGKVAGGGGGGGDGDKLPAAKGSPPKFARQQITPPVVVVRNEHPILPAEATLVGPPEIPIKQTNAVGDPYSTVMATFSNGPGSRGGIGNGSGGGVGPGNGRGLGPGEQAGVGGGAYRPGWGGVTPPHELYAPDPEYSDEARKAKFQGSVLLWLVVLPDGRTRDIRVVRSVGLGLDEKAMQAVSTWRFDPGRKDGAPVATQINVEVNFRLF